MNTLLTILTIIAFPVFGIYCYKQGREIQKFEDEEKLDRLIEHIKEEQKKYETRYTEHN